MDVPVYDFTTHQRSSETRRVRHCADGSPLHPPLAAAAAAGANRGLCAAPEPPVVPAWCAPPLDGCLPSPWPCPCCQVPPADVVIIEGILVLHMEEIREMLNMKARGQGGAAEREGRVRARWQQGCRPCQRVQAHGPPAAARPSVHERGQQTRHLLPSPNPKPTDCRCMWTQTTMCAWRAGGGVGWGWQRGTQLRVWLAPVGMAGMGVSAACAQRHVCAFRSVLLAGSSATWRCGGGMWAA